MKELLVPIDFSDCTHGLVDQAADVAGRMGMRVHLLHITHPPGDTGAADVDGETGERRLDTEAQGLLDHYRGLVAEHGVDVATSLQHGEPGPAIVKSAKALNVDMIMVGTHGRRGVARLLLGSVSEHVIRRADVPVISVRTQHRPGCEASSCATCQTHITAMERRLQAELDG